MLNLALEASLEDGPHPLPAAHAENFAKSAAKLRAGKGARVPNPNPSWREPEDQEDMHIG